MPRELPPCCHTHHAPRTTASTHHRHPPYLPPAAVGFGSGCLQSPPTLDPGTLAYLPIMLAFPGFVEEVLWRCLLVPTRAETAAVRNSLPLPPNLGEADDVAYVEGRGKEDEQGLVGRPRIGEEEAEEAPARASAAGRRAREEAREGAARDEGDDEGRGEEGPLTHSRNDDPGYGKSYLISILFYFI